MENKIDGVTNLACDIMKASSLPIELSGAIATALYNAGYRKVEQGEWVYKNGDFICTHCNGEILEKTEFSRGCYMGFEYVHSKYCPHCGAKMEEK